MASSNGDRIRESVISVDINRSIRELTVNVKGAGSITLHLERVHADNVDYAAYHGFEQRLRDAAALLRDPVTGLSATAADKLAGITRLVDHYESGSAEWGTRGQGAGGDVAMLVAAIVAAGLKPDSAEMRAKVRALSRVDRAALAALPRVREQLDVLTAKLSAGVDTDALLGTL